MQRGVIKMPFLDDGYSHTRAWTTATTVTTRSRRAALFLFVEMGIRGREAFPLTRFLSRGRGVFLFLSAERLALMRRSCGPNLFGMADRLKTH